MKVKKAFEYLLIALILMTFTSCSSSGGGIGGSGAVSKPVVSKGTITEKGSIFVNGVEFDTTGAAITTDDNPDRAENDLDLGMVVTVRGTVNPNGTTGTADSIEFADNLEGPITGDDDVAKNITVLGQTVKWDISTRCENSSSAAIDCATLAVNNLVEVSGFLTTTGIQATRIEIKKDPFVPGDKVELKGTISDNPTGTTFHIGLQEVDFSAATLKDIPNGILANGMFVEVKGTLDPSLVVLHATKIELEEEGLVFEEGKEVEIEGLVSDFTSCNGSVCSFKVNGQPVQTNASTEFKNVTIANNVRVEVEGTISTGILIAREVSPR